MKRERCCLRYASLKRSISENRNDDVRDDIGFVVEFCDNYRKIVVHNEKNAQACKDTKKNPVY